MKLSFTSSDDDHFSSGLVQGHVKGERVKFFLPGPWCSTGNPLTVSPLHHRL